MEVGRAVMSKIHKGPSDSKGRANDPRRANDSNPNRYFLKENTQMNKGTQKQNTVQSLVIKEMQPEPQWYIVSPQCKRPLSKRQRKDAGEGNERRALTHRGEVI